MSRKSLRAAPFALAAMAALSAASFVQPAAASSHREAPFITTVPKVDGTDFYMFRSYEPGRDAFVTLVANYIPLQDAYGGPNYFSFDPNALYEIHIDNNGNGVEDITFQFRFKNTLADITLPIAGKNISIPLVQAGAISASSNAALNLKETYQIDIVRGDRRGGQRQAVTSAGGARDLVKPFDFIGTKTFGSVAGYEAYAAQSIQTINIPGCATPGKVFVGQRKDPFVVALGKTFDLLNLNPLAVSGGVDDLADKNVSSIALEVASACLTNGTSPIIGGWTTASLRQGAAARRHTAVRAFGSCKGRRRLGSGVAPRNATGQRSRDRAEGQGQVQRLEAEGRRPVCRLRDQPDVAGADRDSVLVGRRACADQLPAPGSGDRVPDRRAGLESTRGCGGVRDAAPEHVDRTDAERFAKPAWRAGGDNAGFPNGRRPGDDVVDMSLRVAMGVLCTLNMPSAFGCVAADAPSGALALTDNGTATSDAMFSATFPYLATPLPGAQ